MENNILENAIRRIAELERNLERHFAALNVDNELSFILKGSYVLENSISNIMAGIY